MQLNALIGTGRTAELYRTSDGNVLKLFHEKYSSDAVDREYRTAVAVTKTGLSVPHVIEKTQRDGRSAIAYEFIEGETMLQKTLAGSLVIAPLAKQLAEEHARIHQYTVENLPTQKLALRSRIEQAKLPQALAQKVLLCLDNAPDGERLCHGDFHPGNVILRGNSAVVIDWNDATIGHPLADVARTSVILNTTAVANVGLNEAARLFHDAYLSHYLDITGSSLGDVERWRIPVAAARMAEDILAERRYLLNIIEQHLYAN